MRPNFFSAFTSDLFCHLASWWNLQGPKVELIEGEPNENQKQRVLATALSADGKAEPKRPDLSVYHLIRIHSEQTQEVSYHIGYCAREGGWLSKVSLVYKTRALNPKSSSLRYVSDDLEDRTCSQLFPGEQQYSQDRLLIEYIEAEIRAGGGLVHSGLKNRSNIALTQKSFAQWMRGQGLTRDNTISIRQVFHLPFLLEEASHCLMYGKENTMMKILRANVSLLSSQYQAAVMHCAPEIRFHPLPIFKLAYVLGDWFAWKEMVLLVKQAPNMSPAEKDKLLLDMRIQVEDVDANGVPVDYDNLRNKGLGIHDWDYLEANPDKKARYREDVKKRNSYYLIIKMTGENDDRRVEFCALAYRGVSGEYALHFIFSNQANLSPHQIKLLEIAPMLHACRQNANDGCGNEHQHYFSRSTQVLRVTRAVLEQDLKVPTCWVRMLKPLKFEVILAHLKDRIENWRAWSEEGGGPRLREHWHGVVMAAAREEFSIHAWEFWTSKENPWSSVPEEMARFINRRVRLRLDDGFNYEPLLPLISLGNSYYPEVVGSYRGYGCMAAVGFINSYLESRSAREEELKGVLAGRREFDEQQSACCLQ